MRFSGVDAFNRLSMLADSGRSVSAEIVLIDGSLAIGVLGIFSRKEELFLVAGRGATIEFDAEDADCTFDDELAKDNPTPLELEADKKIGVSFAIITLPNEIRIRLNRTLPMTPEA